MSESKQQFEVIEETSVVLYNQKVQFALNNGWELEFACCGVQSVDPFEDWYKAIMTKDCS